MNKKVIEKIKTAESTISMILGIIVVIVVGVLLANYFRGLKPSPSIPGKQGAEEPTITPVAEVPSAIEGKPVEGLPEKYQVQSGDSLWKVSVRLYGSGYNWVDIAKANNLTTPGLIQTSQTLIIPRVAARIPTTAGKDKKTPITENSYTIQKGDNLWNISVRAYQDGYKWPEIAKANNIVNPNIIHAGNILTIPR